VNEQQIKDWLGVGDIHKRLRPEIVAGMADVPMPPPGPTNQHVPTMSAFLRAVGGPPGAVDLWEPARQPVHIRFVTWDAITDGVAVYHDDKVVWQDQSFDSFAQYLANAAPLGVPVILHLDRMNDDAH
jgi:hypothetical protein